MGQFLASQAANAGTGDPSMMLVAPTEQLRSEYMFIVPPSYDVNSITIIAKADTEITLDETQYFSNDFDSIEGSDWFKFYLEIETGGYLLEASEPVGLYIYGYSQYVSYAYTGGLDFEVINEP